MPKDVALRQYTKRVWLTVAIVSAVVVVIAATTWLIQGVLLLFAGLLFGVFLNHLSRQLAAHRACSLWCRASRSRRRTANRDWRNRLFHGQSNQPASS